MDIMKSKKMQRVLLVIIMVMTLVTTIYTSVLATEPATTTTPSDMVGEQGSVDSETITNAGKQIIYILQTVGIVLSVIVLIVIGIKYMMGSAEEKAEYKKTFMPYIVGAALVFAASVFAQVAYDFFTGITG